MESSGLVVLAIGGVYLAFVSNNSNAIVPILGSYALGSQKLLPALQIIYNGWSNVKGSSADLTTVINSLSYSLTQIPTLSRGFEFSRKIEFKNVSYSYPGSNKIFSTIFLWQSTKVILLAS